MNKLIKIFLIVLLFSVFAFNAQAIGEETSIADLQAQIAQLKAKILQLQSQLAGTQDKAVTAPKAVVASCQFGFNLRYGNRGSEMNALHAILEKEGFSLGQEKASQYFGDFTRAAVVAFQERYASDVLSPWGLGKGTGFVGKTTRQKLSEICKRYEGAPSLSSGPTVSFSYSVFSALENEAQAVITVNLSESVDREVSVNYKTVEDTATPNIDYVPAEGVLTFDPNQNSATFNVNILDDEIAEADEIVKLKLFNTDGCILGSTVEADLDIVDDDRSTPTIFFRPLFYSVEENEAVLSLNVSLSNSTPEVVTVNYNTSNLTAKAGSDYQAVSGSLTFDSNQTSKTIAVNILDDSIQEGDEIFNVTLKNAVNANLGLRRIATITIKDDEEELAKVYFEPFIRSVNEDSVTLGFNVSLSQPSASEVLVDYYTSDFTAQAGSDYEATNGTLVFESRETSKDILVTIMDDELYEGNEIFNISLSNPVNAELGARRKATITIKDDEGSLPKVYFYPILNNINEDDQRVILNVRLSKAIPETVTVDYYTANITAKAGSDYEAVEGTITFEPNQTSKTIPVAIIDDNVNEWNEMFYVKLKSPVNAELGVFKAATVTIIDNDSGNQPVQYQGQQQQNL